MIPDSTRKFEPEDGLVDLLHDYAKPGQELRFGS